MQSQAQAGPSAGQEGGAVAKRTRSKRQPKDGVEGEQEEQRRPAAVLRAHAAVGLKALMELLEREVKDACVAQQARIRVEDAEFWRLCANPPTGDLRHRAHPYQVEGVQFLSAMYDCGMGAILGDDMGLGKTMQTVLFILRLRTKGVKGPILIVAPSHLLTQWKCEFELWCRVLQLPQVPVMVVHGNKEFDGFAKDATGIVNAANRAEAARRRWYDGLVAYADAHDGEWPILITSHSLFASQSEAACLRALPGQAAKSLQGWALTVVDEAHHAKNSQTRLYSNLLKHNTKTFLLLTGTIVHNDLHSELVALLNLVMPPMVRDYDMVSHLLFDRKSIWEDGRLPKDSLRQLSRILYVFLKRRTVRSAGVKMPPRVRCVIEVPQSPLQEYLYDRVDFVKRVCGDQEGSIGAAPPEQLWKLLADKHPFLLHMVFNAKRLPDPVPGLSGGVPDKAERRLARRFQNLVCGASYKVIMLMSLLKRLTDAGHRTLVFSQSVPTLNMLSILLHINGYPHDLISGSTGMDKRTARKNRFNNPPSADTVKHIMLLSTRAMGQGVNLAGADTEIFFDHDWNPQNDNQAESRSYRVDQTRPVLIIHLLTRHSEEMKRDEGTLQEKRDMQVYIEQTAALQQTVRDRPDPAEAEPRRVDYATTIGRLLTNRERWTDDDSACLLRMKWKVPESEKLSDDVAAYFDLSVKADQD